MPIRGRTYSTAGPFTVLVAVLAYRRGTPPVRIIQDLGINRSTLFRWVHKYESDAGKLESLLRTVANTGEVPDPLDP
jgi:transposase-like protein